MSTILAINPGSTSTKLGLFQDGEELGSHTYHHPPEEAAEPLSTQAELRSELLASWFKKNRPPQPLTAVIGRGGLLGSVAGGIYVVNEPMLAVLKECRFGTHPCNLGAPLAASVAKQEGVKAYVSPPVSTDEFAPLARYSGSPLFSRKSAFHALNHKATAKEVATRLGRPYCEVNLVVAHMGGGITVGAHQKGRVIDANHGIAEGPFSPQRAGAIPSLDLLDLCFSGKYTRKEIYSFLHGKGGLTGYLGSSDVKTLTQQAASDDHVRETLDAMIYQIAKEIGALAAVLSGKVDAVVLTGGMAQSAFIIEKLKSYISFVAEEIFVIPGENEMVAMVCDLEEVLRGLQQALTFTISE